MELLQRARQGDQQGRDRLFAACRHYLDVVARSQVESWLQAKVDASDLVQETLFEAHRDFHRFQGGTQAEWLAWLRGILRHNAHDMVRRYRGTGKRQTRREVPLDRGPAADDSRPRAYDPPADAASPSQLAMRRDDELLVAAALMQLSPDHREVILLRNLEQLPFDEVARRMGRSRPAAQMLWMRALQKLQLLLRDGDGSVPGLSPPTAADSG